MDEYAGKDYSHRKDWVIDRLRTLSAIFAINLCKTPLPPAARYLAWLVMSNHYHTVLFVDMLRAREWSEDEVIERSTRLFKLPAWVQRYRDGKVSLAEQDAAKQTIEKSTPQNNMAQVRYFARQRFSCDEG